MATGDGNYGDDEAVHGSELRAALAGILDEGEDECAGVQPMGVADLRQVRVQQNGGGSGSIAAQTERYRAAANSQLQQVLGFDPAASRHAWKNTCPSMLLQEKHAEMVRMQTLRAADHSAECPLCILTIEPMTDDELCAGYDQTDVRQKLSALLAMCCDTLAREQMITALCQFYERSVFIPSSQGGGRPLPSLSREVCREHLRHVVLPGASRRRSVVVLEEIQEFLSQTYVRQNSISGAVTPDIKAIGALVKTIAAKEAVLRSLDHSAAEPPVAGRGAGRTSVAAARAIRAATPGSAVTGAGVRNPQRPAGAVFPGSR
ncbi:MAG: hypothetical protein WC732_09745 [Candidatus Omnitrophota bacterium]